MKTKVVLIGGAGFIGHNIALRLKKDDFDVFVVDGLNVNNLLSFQDRELENRSLYRSILNNRLDLLQNEKIELQVQDARSYHSISKIIDSYNPDIIIHLAAVSHSNKSNKDPHSTFDHSLRTLENVLDASKGRKKIPHIIYISSSMVYGNFDGKEVKEDDTLNPIGIYGTLKLSGELMVKAYNQVFGMPYTIIRPSALYGERCVSRRVSQIFIENTLLGKEITINGDGKEKLDFTYIEDLYHGIFRCIKSKNSKNQIFNITYGQGREVNELINILEKKLSKVKRKFLPKSQLTPERGTLSTEKAKNLIDYEPTFNLETGYGLYIDWYLKFFDNFKKQNEI
tara:strand:+ start:674 stop:1693 length:1020 start_codon:yes stop_codon:yes gene_type:complete